MKSLLEKLRRATGSAPEPTAPEPPTQAAPAPRSPLQNLPHLELVLGVDLGTSCTKVVIGDSGWKNQSWVVPFNPALPGIAAFLHPTASGAERNLKMRLMDAPHDAHLRRALADCLAATLRHAITWFQKNAPLDYSRRTLRWNLNLGFPAKSLADSALKSAYLEVARLAVDAAIKPANGARATAELYPEIAAQLAGYIRSPYAKPGNLLLVDVGAGTLDVSTLILGQAENQDLVSFQVCRVNDLGALRLLQRRIETLNAQFPNRLHTRLADFQDGARALPDSVGELVSNPSPGMHEAFQSAGKSFSEDVLGTILGCLVGFRQRLKSCHANSGFDPFGQNLRIMLTGGGSRAQFFRNRVLDGPLERELTRYTRWATDPGQRQSLGQGLLVEPLPMPRDLQNLPAALRQDFDRLSVAYGLAFGGRNLMEVICPEPQLEALPAQKPAAPGRQKRTFTARSTPLDQEALVAC
jgi:hypothetical protein